MCDVMKAKVDGASLSNRAAVKSVHGLVSEALRHGGSGGVAPRVLVSALGGSEWSASRPGRFIRGKEPAGCTPGSVRTLCKWVGPFTAGHRTRSVHPLVTPTDLPQPQRRLVTSE
jgi:hypothetical protein